MKPIIMTMTGSNSLKAFKFSYSGGVRVAYELALVISQLAKNPNPSFTVSLKSAPPLMLCAMERAIHSRSIHTVQMPSSCDLAINTSQLLFTRR